MDEKEKQTLTKLQNQLVIISCFIGFKQTSKIYTCAYSRDNFNIHPQKKKKGISWLHQHRDILVKARLTGQRN